MPTIAQDGEFSFIVHTRELPFEPPHVHVRFGGEEVRNELLGGTFMDEPAAGKRRAILEAFERHAHTILTAWHGIRGEEPNRGN